MTQPVYIAIIGLGAIGERLIPSFLAHPHYSIKAICDVDHQHMEKINSAYKLNAATYTSFEELLKDPSVNSVYIAVPPKWHYIYTMQAINKGKHILCEKPLANSLSEAMEMVKAADDNGIINAIHFPLHYSQEAVSLNEKLPEIGQLKRIELTMRFETWPRSWQQNDWIAKREQGGFIREITPHFIQLTHSLAGEISDIQSIVQYPGDHESCETSIIASGMLSGNVPIIINGHSGIGMKDDLTYRLFGTKGVLSLDQWAQLKQGSLTQPLELIQSREDRSSHSVLEEFHNAINLKKANLVSFQEGHAVQRTLEELL
ncbi:Gfo/Idh/MocA family protein [Jeotgalibacillus proteolyticus]|uniref:Gfo/Idh/MocA family oxidoreductase n=1 Tax=Jeotgalibacillus proteolyticus TaxID=2082395 RepID=A0A2S5G7M9_9BACL|nr:Gfo/Idh/MocA family oxidoreductase [Jeotgalibacillus proteolyticus]PPA68997.1 gfo/Idh/MocA family oxidoreductase [Jeotgalibacillus proteolyticus]